MFYIRKINGNDEYRPVSPYYGTAWYEERGWMLYPGSLPQSRVTVEGGTVDADGITRGGTITELPEPEPTTEIVSKKAVIRVFKGMIAAGDLTAPEMLKNILGGIADLTTDLAPGDDFDLLNPHVSAWLAPMEMTVDDLRAALAALEPEDAENEG